MERLVRQAVAQGARLVMFHEGTVCDYTPKVEELSEQVPDGPACRRMGSLAKQLGCFVSFGLSERDGDRFYITQAFFGPDGFVYRYRKTWLYRNDKDDGYRNEHARYDPGTGPERFTIDGIVASCFICADRGAPRCLQRLKALHPQLVFHPNNHPGGAPGYSVYAEKAKEIGAPMLVTNRVGNSWNRDCLGGTGAFDGQGNILAKANCERREEVLLVDLVIPPLAEAGTAAGAEPPRAPATYREAKEFLARHTRVIELAGKGGGAVAVCPDWQGRVMTSTCGGPDGLSFGFINREYIEAGRPDPHFNNLGAEDRFWLSPEGGPFSLWFKPGAQQTLDNWFTPPAFNEGAFELASAPDASRCQLAKRMQVQNAAGALFDLLVSREVRLLAEADLAKMFGESVAKTMGATGVKAVAYETVNTLTNQGPPMSKDTGLVSIWMLSMLNAGPQTVIIVPYRRGDELQRGPVVKSDYFGAIPPERLKITPQAILLRADANWRSKIGTSQKRAKNVLGSIDFAQNVLTLAHFSMPEDPAKVDYMNNMWGLDQSQPYTGDVANAYNDGPSAPGKKGMGVFCEIESLSPALPLKTGQSLTHHHATIHIQADRETLARIARQTLGVELEQVRQEMGLP